MQQKRRTPTFPRDDLPSLIDRFLGKPLHVRKPIRIFISEFKEPTAPEQEFPWWFSPEVAEKYTSEAIRAIIIVAIPFPEEFAVKVGRVFPDGRDSW